MTNTDSDTFHCVLAQREKTGIEFALHRFSESVRANKSKMNVDMELRIQTGKGVIAAKCLF